MASTDLTCSAVSATGIVLCSPVSRCSNSQLKRMVSILHGSGSPFQLVFGGRAIEGRERPAVTLEGLMILHLRSVQAAFSRVGAIELAGDNTAVLVAVIAAVCLGHAVENCRGH